MKKFFSFFFVIVFLIGSTNFCYASEADNRIDEGIATSNAASATYFYELSSIIGQNYDDYFIVPKNGIFNSRKVYLSGGARFVNGEVKNIVVSVGNKSFNILADGSVGYRGEITVATDMPVILSISGINSNCIVSFDVYVN